MTESAYRSLGALLAVNRTVGIVLVSLLPPAIRAEGVGLYWGLRSVAICSASIVGALVWYAFGPDRLLYLAFVLGCLGGGGLLPLCPRDEDEARGRRPLVRPELTR